MTQIISTRRRRGWVATLLAIALIAACGDDGGGTDDATGSDGGGSEIVGQDGGSEGDGASPEYGGTISVAQLSQPDTMLPGQAATMGDGTIAESIFDPLVILNGNGEFEPYLAESLEPSEDLTEWTLTLRPDVTFHDGSPLDAETLAWNLEELHLAEGATTRGDVAGAGLTGVEVVDDLSVVFQLSEPNAGFPDVLTTPVGYPVSRQAYEDLGPDAVGTSPVGTGPFAFVEWSRDDRIVVERNEDYWGTDEDGNQLPYLDGVEFRIIPDESTQVQALQAGDVEAVAVYRGANGQQLLDEAEAGSIEARYEVGDEAAVTIPNVLVPPTDDARVRRALILANDPVAIAEAVGSTELTPVGTGYVGPDSAWYSEETASTYPSFDGRNLEEAQALVEEYKNDPNRSDGLAPGDPLSLTYTCHNEVGVMLSAQVYQQLWNEAGFDIELEALDRSSHVAAAVGSSDQEIPFSGDFELVCFRSGVGDRDPAGFFSSHFGPVEISPRNYTNYTSEEIDAQIDALKSTTDFQERYEAFQEISRIANEEALMIWSSNQLSVVGWDDSVEGLVGWTTPSGAPGRDTPGGRMYMTQVHLSAE